MRIDNVSPELGRMLMKAGRSDLLGGFDLDDAAYMHSLMISHSRDIAIYHCLFDKGAAHAAVISPLPPPESTSSNDETLRWVVAKQAEAAALQASAAQAQADQVSAAVKVSGDAISASVGALAIVATNGHGEIEGHATSVLSALRANNSSVCEQLHWIDGHVTEGNSLASAHISAIRQIAGEQESQALSMAGEINESIRSVAVEINEAAGMRSGQILGALETAADVARQRWDADCMSRAMQWNREAKVAESAAKSTLLWRRVYGAILLAILITLLAGRAHAQASPGALVAPVTTASTGGSALTSFLSSAASTNSTSVKASPGNVYTIRVINTTATLYYLRMYNLAAAPTCSSATGFIETIPIPASATGAGVAITQYPQGYSAGIGFCLTAGGSSTDNTNAATGVFITILYK